VQRATREYNALHIFGIPGWIPVKEVQIHSGSEALPASLGDRFLTHRIIKTQMTIHLMLDYKTMEESILHDYGGQHIQGVWVGPDAAYAFSGLITSSSFYVDALQPAGMLIPVQYTIEVDQVS